MEITRAVNINWAGEEPVPVNTSGKWFPDMEIGDVFPYSPAKSRIVRHARKYYQDKLGHKFRNIKVSDSVHYMKRIK